MIIELEEYELELIVDAIREKLDSLVVEINDASRKRKLQMVEEKHSHHLNLEYLLIKIKESKQKQKKSKR